MNPYPLINHWNLLGQCWNPLMDPRDHIMNPKTPPYKPLEPPQGSLGLLQGSMVPDYPLETHADDVNAFNVSHSDCTSSVNLA